MLEIEDVSFSFKGEEKLFSSLSLKLEKGEKILIMGEPGVGKSTFLRILSGSVPKYYPGTLEGTISYEDGNLLELDIPERSHIVSRIPQNTSEGLLFTTVEDEIAFPLENRGWNRERMKKEVERVLCFWELSRYRESSSSHLSGGEKRRLSLAVGDVLSTDILLLDESFDELSNLWRGRLRDYILSSDRSIIVTATHYISAFNGLFDRELELTYSGLVPYQRSREEFSLEKPVVDKADILDVADLLYSNGNSLVPFSLSVPSFHLGKGELCVLKGDNGSGKSTFSKLLCGLRRENEGLFTLNGGKLRQKDRKRLVAYLAQNPFDQLFLPTVMDECLSVTGNEDKIREALKLFDLEGTEYVEELSQGKAKRCQAMVFYLLERPFVIFDELDSALSYLETLKILSLFMKQGSGCLLITHDDKLDSLFDRSYLIEDGRMYEK